MTATAAPATVPTTATATTDPAAVAGPRTTPLWRTGVVAGAAAALATTAVAGAALAAGVPLTVEGEQIPLVGFAQITLLCTAIGVLLAKGLSRWSSRPR